MLAIFYYSLRGSVFWMSRQKKLLCGGVGLVVRLMGFQCLLRRGDKRMQINALLAFLF